MRLEASILSVLASLFLLIHFAVAIPVLDVRIPSGRICDYNARGPLLAARQAAATKDFARLYLEEKDVQAAFDKYIPGVYVNHNPGAPANAGRQFSIDALTALFAALPGWQGTNIKAWAGEGLGTIHFKAVVPPENGTAGSQTAIIDYFKFKGTCIVEHWDVFQTITGDEINPIAFF